MKRKIKQQTTRQISYYTVSIHSHFYTYMSTFWLSLVGLRTSIAESLLGIHNVCELFFSLYVLVLLLLFCSVLLSRVIVFFFRFFFSCSCHFKADCCHCSCASLWVARLISKYFPFYPPFHRILVSNVCFMFVLRFGAILFVVIITLTFLFDDYVFLMINSQKKLECWESKKIWREKHAHTQNGAQEEKKQRQTCPFIVKFFHPLLWQRKIVIATLEDCLFFSFDFFSILFFDRFTRVRLNSFQCIAPTNNKSLYIDYQL